MEIQSAFETMKTPSEALPIYLPPAIALVLGGLALRQAAPRERAVFLAPLFALAALIAVSLWQLRGVPGANLVAQPILVGSLFRLLRPNANYISRLRYLGALVLVSSPCITLASLGGGSIAAAAGKTSETKTLMVCVHPEDVAAMKNLAPGLVASFIDSGPAILATTPHTVLSAPYHRNNDGNKAAYDIFLGNDGEAERILKARHVSYVAVCIGSADLVILGEEAPNGLALRLARGEVPPYLEPIPVDPAEPLHVFRVR
jgi:hypothetical protein